MKTFKPGESILQYVRLRVEYRSALRLLTFNLFLFCCQVTSTHTSSVCAGEEPIAPQAPGLRSYIKSCERVSWLISFSSPLQCDLPWRLNRAQTRRPSSRRRTKRGRPKQRRSPARRQPNRLVLRALRSSFQPPPVTAPRPGKNRSASS